MDRVILAYSGGLDTSVAVHWLKHTRKLCVETFIADLGQDEALDMKQICARALAVGAEQAHTADLREEFVEGFILPALKANAVYEEGYLLATALGRPLIAERLVKIAQKRKCKFVAHGCTGKGNDQVRFETTIAALDPTLKVIAPLREWEMKSREEEIEYAAKHKIPVPVSKKSPYSLDKNLWGMSIECGVLEDPWVGPPEDAYQMTKNPAKAPNKPEEVVVSFEQGRPVALNEKPMGLMDLIVKLNAIAGAHGVGRADCIENRVVGIKSREIYEAPAGTVLHTAHRNLEALVLSRDLMHFKEIISQRYSEIIYGGLWFGEMRRALDAFIESSQRLVTGDVRVRLFKGRAVVTGRRSPYSLYSEELATYTEADRFDHKAAEGFIKLYSLPSKAEGGRER